MLNDEMIKLAKSQVGYKETGENHNKYAQYFDTPKEKNGPYPWFNGKKQNVAWCAIFICWLFVMVLEPKNILGSPDKVRQWLKFPKPADNCAAGCPYLWSYLKSRFGSVAKAKGQPGDIIFFNAKCTHVGIIEKISNGKYITIEGNKNNGVARGEYSINSTKIYGIIHPNYSDIEPKPGPEPTPEPTPTPQPTTEKYKVKTNGSPLALRCAPNTKAYNIAWMPNKSDITVSGFVTGEKVYGNDQWARATYKGKTGYCSAKWITKA